MLPLIFAYKGVGTTTYWVVKKDDEIYNRHWVEDGEVLSDTVNSSTLESGLKYGHIQIILGF